MKATKLGHDMSLFLSTMDRHKFVHVLSVEMVARHFVILSSYAEMILRIVRFDKWSTNEY